MSHDQKLTLKGVITNAIYYLTTLYKKNNLQSTKSRVSACRCASWWGPACSRCSPTGVTRRRSSSSTASSSSSSPWGSAATPLGTPYHSAQIRSKYSGSPARKDPYPQHGDLKTAIILKTISTWANEQGTIFCTCLYCLCLFLKENQC